MGDAAVAVQTPAPEPQATAEAPKLDIKTEIVEKLKAKKDAEEKAERKREREKERRAEQKAQPKTEEPKAPAKEPAKREEAAPEKDAKKAPAKDAKKPEAKPGKDEPEAEQSEATPDEGKELKAQRRQFAKFQRKKEAEYASREAQLVAREERVGTFERRLKEDLRRDPVKTLRELGVDVRRTLMDFTVEDSEDPRDKAVREAKLTAEEAKKRTDELSQVEAQRRAEAAQQRIHQVIRTAWESVEPDEYPYLSSMYEPDEIASLARKVVLKHYADTKRQLAPEQAFQYLEDYEREDDERKQAARNRRQTIGSRESESREQVPSVKPESPESSRTRDVTNRATRIASFGGPASEETPEERRERLASLVRQRLRR